MYLITANEQVNTNMVSGDKFVKKHFVGGNKAQVSNYNSEKLQSIKRL